MDETTTAGVTCSCPARRAIGDRDFHLALTSVPPTPLCYAGPRLGLGSSSIGERGDAASEASFWTQRWLPGDLLSDVGDPTQTCATAPPGHGVLEAAVKAAEPQVRMAILKELLRDMSLLEKVRREQ